MACHILYCSIRFFELIELVMVFRIVYMVSYGSMLIVWTVLGLYILVIGNMIAVLMGIVFYGGLIIVTILIVIPNGNAHYYYSGAIMIMAMVTAQGSVYLGVLTLAIMMLVLIL